MTRRFGDMKRLGIPFFMLILIVGLSACGNFAGNGATEQGEMSAAREAESGDVSTPAVSDQGSALSSEAPAPSTEGVEGEAHMDEHSHSLAEGNNIVEHEAMGYCGNTVTTISCQIRQNDDPWEVSFWGSDSVALTDLLRYLDYSGDVCRCLPEYTVDTEFGTEYGINLTEGYVRHDGGQVSLTEEQIRQIREILDRQSEQPGEE